MILADKIIEERKRFGYSQEELAEQLNVSRQSVSKWESAQSIPDINRILRMAQLFGVSTDYLLRDDAVRETVQAASSFPETAYECSSVRSVSMEEASAFIALRKEQAPVIALGVALCVLCPVPLMFLSAAAVLNGAGPSENTAGIIGVVILLIMVAIAVYLFIRCSHAANKYEYLEKYEIETAYGIDGMAREKKAGFEGRYTRFVAIGVVLCILSSVPLILSSAFIESEAAGAALVGLLLIIVAIAVYLFVYAGTIKDSYDILLQEGDFTVNKKKNAPLLNRITCIYWLAVVAIFLAVSLPNKSWDRSWVVWPVAGILFAIVIIISKMIISAED